MSPRWDGYGPRVRVRPTVEFTHSHFIGVYVVYARYVSDQSSQDSLDLTGSGQRRSTVSPRWDGYGPRVRLRPMLEITHSHFVALLLLRAVRLGAILLPPVDDFCHPGGIFPDAICAQGIFSAHHSRSRRCKPAGLFGVR